MVIFNGTAFAQKKEAALQPRVAALLQRGVHLKMAAVLFVEDKGSQLYTSLKKDAAQRLGIAYEVFPFSLLDAPEVIRKKLDELNADTSVTGIIIQKPARKTWEAAWPGNENFTQWWHALVIAITPHKDVDGLHPATLAAIERGTWRAEHKVMPATAQAVLSILTEAGVHSSDKIVILGKTDLLGKPLYFELKNQKYDVEMIGSKELQHRIELGQYLHEAQVIISATGQSNIITSDMVNDDVVVIDVGEPKPDVDFTSVAPKARFITPVPGGVGPVTVVSLMENCTELAESSVV